MKIEFQTATWEVQNLEGDLQRLKDTLGFPCEFSSTVVASKEPRSSNDVAIAFYGKNEINAGVHLIEINTKYFKHKQDDRILILLHEIIHCCQRTGALQKVNDKYIKLGKRIDDLVGEYIKNHGRDKQFSIFWNSLYAIGLFYSWIFEIWDEMLLKTKYKSVLEKKLSLTFCIINKKIDKNTYRDYGCWAKYRIFIYIVRACYLQKISKNLGISEQFEDLKQRYIATLKQITNDAEFTQLMDQLDSLTSIDDFFNSDTSNLEKSYDVLIETMICHAKASIPK